jgi:SAM-dependent methyltransferase
MPEPDEISYGDLTFQDSHPGVTSAIASLAGLTPPAVETCRVLELGCGTGFNLLAMSQSIPGGKFTGIDYSPVHISRANEVAGIIGANNVSFHCLSIDNFHAAPGSFDYIIAHGVYSWVPAPIRDAILAIIVRHLSPNGLAYISYNTHPGWHLRSLVRDSLRFFASSPSPRQGVDRLTESLVVPDSLYSRVLRAEWADARALPDYYIAHEYLVPDNDPVFFHDFVRHAAAFDLQFAAEARFISNSFAQSEKIQAQLEDGNGGDPIRREQHLDWLVGRYFRQTLLCHAGLPLTRDPDPQGILAMRIAPTAEILERSSGNLRVRQALGKELEVTDEAYLQIIRQLEGTGAIPAREIELPGLPGPIVAAVLWSGWRDGLWALRADEPFMTHTLSERPRACPLARVQAAAGPDCTNRFHRRVCLTAEEQHLLQTLDGSRSIGPADKPTLARLAALGLLTNS